MDLYKEIILNFLKYEDTMVHVSFPNLTLTEKEIVDLTSYRCLRKIQQILKDDSLNDEECFYKIEEIIHVFEKLGSDCGNRHDFG